MSRAVKATIMFLGLLTVLTQSISIYISNTKSLESVEATKLRAKFAELKEKNINLQTEVLVSSSYNTISSRAGELGYLNTREFVSLYDPIEVAVGR